MLRLGKLAEQNRIKNQDQVNKETEDGEASSQRLEDEAKKAQDDDDEENGGAQDKILTVEEGDILGRYRIPVKTDKVDYDLQLPDDNDSSNSSSEEDKNVIKVEGNDANNAPADNKDD